MSILGFILIVVLIGVVLYLVTTFIPMDQRIKNFLVIAVIVMLIIWLIQLIGILPSINTAPIPHIR